MATGRGRGPGQSVTLALADEVDASRGDVIAAVEHPPQVADRLVARLFWTADRPAAPGTSFHLQLGPARAVATVASVRTRIDPDTGSHETAVALRPNDIGEVTLALDRPVVFDPYRRSRETGGFILIDEASSDTCAMGLVLSGLPGGDGVRESGGCSRLRAVAARLAISGERPWRSLAKAVSWRVLGSIDTMLLAYLFTRDARVSAAIGFTEIATKVVLYYGHERVWARIGLGVSRREGNARRSST